MYVILETKEEYAALLNGVNNYMGYPNNMGTVTWCDTTPTVALDGNYYLPVCPVCLHLFENLEITDTYPYQDLGGEG